MLVGELFSTLQRHIDADGIHLAAERRIEFAYFDTNFFDSREMRQHSIPYPSGHMLKEVGGLPHLLLHDAVDLQIIDRICNVIR